MQGPKACRQTAGGRGPDAQGDERLRLAGGEGMVGGAGGQRAPANGGQSVRLAQQAERQLRPALAHAGGVQSQT